MVYDMKKHSFLMYSEGESLSVRLPNATVIYMMKQNQASKKSTRVRGCGVKRHDVIRKPGRHHCLFCEWR